MRGERGLSSGILAHEHATVSCAFGHALSGGIMPRPTFSNMSVPSDRFAVIRPRALHGQRGGSRTQIGFSSQDPPLELIFNSLKMGCWSSKSFEKLQHRDAARYAGRESTPRPSREYRHAHEEVREIASWILRGLSSHRTTFRARIAHRRLPAARPRSCRPRWTSRC